jgi:hypothetical protein
MVFGGREPARCLAGLLEAGFAGMTPNAASRTLAKATRFVD